MEWVELRTLTIQKSNRNGCLQLCAHALGEVFAAALRHTHTHIISWQMWDFTCAEHKERFRIQ